MSAPTYERVGKLAIEEIVHLDDDGKVVGRGMFAAELYECSECHALVWWPAIDRHTAWHYPSNPAAVTSAPAEQFDDTRAAE